MERSDAKDQEKGAKGGEIGEIPETYSSMAEFG